MTQDTRLDALRDQVIAAKEAGKSLHICGGKTRWFYGEAFPEDGSAWLDMSALTGVVSYEPTEMVITARAGTPLVELEALLADNNQMLAFEPPRFGAADTLGGCVATGLSGPARMAAGPLSDFVLGSRLLTANGEVLHFGGEVMKNVAGYDVSRLLAGSLGMLGALVEVSMKVVPQPPSEATCRLAVDEADALKLCQGWRRQLMPITATAWEPVPDARGRLSVRLAGNAAAVRQGLATIGGDELPADTATLYWHSVRDQQHDIFAARPLWRVVLPPGVASLGPYPQLHEWGGLLRWVAGVDNAAEWRAKIAALGGSATLYRRGNLPADIATFPALKPVIHTLHKRLKQQFDPQEVFNPGRLIKGL